LLFSRYFSIAITYADDIFRQTAISLLRFSSLLLCIRSAISQHTLTPFICCYFFHFIIRDFLPALRFSPLFSDYCVLPFLAISRAYDTRFVFERGFAAAFSRFQYCSMSFRQQSEAEAFSSAARHVRLPATLTAGLLYAITRALPSQNLGRHFARHVSCAADAAYAYISRSARLLRFRCYRAFLRVCAVSSFARGFRHALLFAADIFAAICFHVSFRFIRRV